MRLTTQCLALLLCLPAYGNPDRVLPISPKAPLDFAKSIEDAEVTAAVKSAMDALVGAGKYVMDKVDSEKKSDGSSAVSTTITLFDKAGVDLSAIYKDKKILALEVEFPEELTINFTHIDQIVDNKLSAYLPGGFPMNAGVWVQSLAASFDNSSQVVPNLMEATIALGSPWEILGAGSFQASDVNVVFAVENPKQPSRAISGTLSATANLGNIPMSITSTLSSDSESNGITAKIEQVNLQNVLDAVVGNEAQQFLSLTPDLFKSLELSKAEFSIFPVKRSLNFKATTTMGGVIVDLSKASGAQKVMFALRPPPSFKFSELAGILAPMDNLDMSGSYFIVSNKQTQISTKFLDPTSDNDGKFDVKKGLNLVTSIALPQEMRDMLKVKNISLVGSMPPSFNGINIYGKIETDLSLGDGAISFDEIGAGLLLEAGEVELRLEGAGSFRTGQDRVQIYGGLIMSATDQLIELEAGLSAGGRRALKPESCLVPQAEWKDPFGVPGAGIRSLGIRAGVGAKFPWINTVGLEGKVRFGTVKNQSKHICGGLTAYVSLADPTESMLIAEVRNMKPISFIEAFAEDVKIQGALRDVLNTGIEQAKLKIVPKEMELFGQTYSRGIALDSMKMSLAGINGLIGFSFGAETGIKAYGAMDPYILEEGGVTFFGIKGARPDAKGNITGPSISLGLDAVDPHFKLSGNINLLGIERQSFIQVNKSGFEFETTGKVLGGALGVTAHIKAGKLTSTSGLYVKAAFENRLQTMVADKLLAFIKSETKKNQEAYRKAQKTLAEAKTNNDFEQFWVDAAGETVGAFKEMDRGAAIAGSYVVKGLLKDALNVRKLSFEGEVTSIKGKVEIEVDMTVAGSVLKEKVKAELTLSEDAFTDLIVSVIGDEVIEFFGQLDNTIADAFDDLGDELETAFEDLGNEIVNVAEDAGEGIIDAAEFLGNGIIDGVNAIDDFFNGSRYSPPVSNGTFTGVPVNHTHFRITVNAIKVTDDEGGLDPALDLFGSITTSLSGPIKTNKGATPFLYARSERNNKSVDQGSSISVNQYLDFYVDNDRLRNGQGGTFTINSRMGERDDFGSENLGGSASVKLDFWDVGTATNGTVTGSDNDGETISISFYFQVVNRRGPIPTPSQMMAVVRSGNINEMNRLVSEGGRLRGSGMIESAIQGNAHPSIVQRLLQEGNRAKTSQVTLASNSQYYNTEIIKMLISNGARVSETALLNVVSRRDIPMVDILLKNKAVPQLRHVQAAIKANDVAMINKLINASRTLQVGQAELQYAVEHNNTDLVRTFVNRAATSTPGMITKSIEKGNNNMVELLLPVGEADHTALQAAANKNDALLFKTLIENRVSLIDSKPINTAIDKSNYEIIQIALDNGGSVTSTLDYAIAKNNKKAIIMALDRGANGTPAIKYAVDKNDLPLFKDIVNNHGGDANQAMSQAYLKGNLEMGKIALNAGANPNTQFSAASSTGKLEWVKEMLNKNATPDSGIKGAVDGQHISVVQLLIHSGAKANEVTYLQSAARNKNLKLAQVLVEEGNANPEFGRRIALDNNDVPMVEYLLSKGAKPTGLKIPAQNGWFNMVKTLIKYKADPNEGIQASIAAIKNDIAIYLLDAGADAQPKPYIEMATWKGSDALVAKLLEKGANANFGTLNAAKYKRTNTMKMLIQAKADVSKASLMNIAVSNFQQDMIVLLLANNGDIQYIVPKNKQTYLHRVSDKKGKANLVKIFIDAGVPVDAVDKNQETALHKAVRTGRKNAAAVRYLIQAGANVNAKDKRGRSVLKRANNKAAKELVSAAGGVK